MLLLLSLPAFAQRSRIVPRGITEDPAVWLEQRAVPLESVRLTLPWFSGARIVGLGEATHGTHEFFVAKRRIVEMLVLDAGFTTIAFEAPYAEWQNVVADPRRILESPDYFFWDAQEILDTIEWARDHNVRVVGVDPSHPHPTMDLVLASIDDSSLRADVAMRYECLSQYRDTPFTYNRLPESIRIPCRDSIRSVRPLLEGEALIHAARIVEQGEEALATGLASRDGAMAENLLWLTGKVIFWGHNAHVGKTPYQLNGPAYVTSTGSLLGDEYAAIGTLALRGTFWASENGFIAQQTMTEAGPDDYASWFSVARMPEMLVPLRGRLPAWLDAPKTMRIGAANVISRERATIEVVEDLDARFDAVIYFEDSRPSQLRHFPVR